MNMKILVTLILLTSFVFAATTISDCTDLTSAGETYNLNANITNKQPSTVYCMRVSAANIVLNCQNNKIDGNDSYAVYSSTKYGVQVLYAGSNFTLMNCNVSDWYFGIAIEANTTKIYNTILQSGEFSGVYAISYSTGNQYENVSLYESGTFIYETGRNLRFNNISCYDCVSRAILLELVSPSLFHTNVNITNVQCNGIVTSCLLLRNTTNMLVENVSGYSSAVFLSGIELQNSTLKNINVYGNMSIGTINVRSGMSCLGCNNITFNNITLWNYTDGMAFTSFYTNRPTLNTRISNSSINSSNFSVVINGAQLTFINVKHNSTILSIYDNASVWIQEYIRFNFTMPANFTINNSKNGIVKNESTITNFSSWIVVNTSTSNATLNTSFNPYTLIAYPSNTKYATKTMDFSFNDTTTFNVTFNLKSNVSIDSINLCNSTSCGTLGTPYKSTSFNCSAIALFMESSATQEINFNYYVNGILYSSVIVTGVVNSTLTYPPIGVSGLNKGDSIICGAIAYNGTNYSEQVNSSSVVINNSAPSTSGANLNILAPLTTDTLTCSAVGYTDPDSDSVNNTYYRWWKNGVVQAGQTSSTCSLAAISASQNDRIQCSVKQDDSGYQPKNSTEVYSPNAYVSGGISNCAVNIYSSGYLVLTTDLTDKNTGTGVCFQFLSDNVVFDCAGHTIDGVGLETAIVNWKGDTSVYTNNFTLKNCIIKEFNRAFWFVEIANDITVDNCTLLNDGPDSAMISSRDSNIAIDKVKVINTRLYNGSSLYIFKMKNSLIENVTSENSTTYGVYVGGITGTLAENNNTYKNISIYNSTDIGMYTRYQHNATFTNITISKSVQSGLSIDNGNNISLNSITSYSNTKFGIALGINNSVVNNVVISNNTASASGTGGALHLSSCYNTIVTNMSTLNNTDSMYVAGSTSGNIIKDSSFGSTTANDVRFSVAGTNIIIRNSTYLTKVRADAGELWTQQYVKLNFTSGGTPDNAVWNMVDVYKNNYQSGTASGGLTSWLLVNITNFTSSSNISFSQYNVNATPSNTEYPFNSQYITFSYGGTYNITLTNSSIVTFVPPTPNAGATTSDGWIYVNVTVEDFTTYTIDTCILNWNGVNESMTKVGSGTSVSCWTNKTTSGGNNYTYIVYANNSNGTWGNSGTRINSESVFAPILTFISQSPADISSINILSITLNVTYNITTASYESVNASTVKLWHKTNTSTNDCGYYINGTQVCGFVSTEVLVSNVSNTWTFKLADNAIYPASYNINQPYMEATAKSTSTLSNQNDLYKIRLFNISNSKQYGFFEVYANDTSGSNPLRVYYCNSTYTTGLVSSSSNCVQIATITTTQTLNHSHGVNSYHYAISFGINTTTGTINGIKVSSTSYFVLRGNTGTNWVVYYISNVSDVNAIQTSGNGGNSWSNFVGTADAHIHQYDGTDTFRYFLEACSNATPTNICTNSSIRTDLLDLGGIPPTAPSVYSPVENMSYTINTTISINYTASISPNAYAISFYNISLVNVDTTFNKTIYTNNSLNLSYNWNSTGTSIGEYIIRVEAKDVNGLSSFGYSGVFNITDNASSCGIITNNTILYNNITSTGTCITIGANDITLDCNGYQITYGTTYSNSSGVYTYQWNNTVIKNCVIFHDGPTGSTINGYAIQFNQSNENGIITNNTIISNERALLFSNYTRNFTISYNRITINSTYSNKYGILGSAYFRYNNIYGNNITVSGTFGWGIYLVGWYIYNNSIYENNILTYGSEAYDILMRSYAYNNKVYSNNLTTRGPTSNNIYVLAWSWDNEFYNNTYTTSGTTAGSAAIVLDGSIGIVYNNTFYNSTITNSSATQIYSTVGATNNTFINVTMNKNRVVFGATGTSNLTIKWYERINVTNVSGSSLPANVNVSDKNGLMVYSGTLSVSGLSPWFIITDLYSNYTENTTFNNHTISVFYPTYTLSTTSYNFGVSSTVNITLQRNIAPSVSSVSITNGDTCTTLTSPVYYGNYLSCKATITDSESSTIPFVYSKIFRNGTLFSSSTLTNIANGSSACAFGVSTGAITIKSDSWTCEFMADDGVYNSSMVNSSTITINNTAPTLSNPVINNTAPRLTDILLCSVIGYSDVDSDPAGSAQYRWWKNGVVQGGQTLSTLILSDIGAVYGDKINCSTTQYDSGYDTKLSTEKFSTQSAVLTAPTITLISLTSGSGLCAALPSPVYVGSTFGCSVTAQDGESAILDYVKIMLYRNGTQVDVTTRINVTNNTNICWTPTVPQWNSIKSDTWTCGAYANDGYLNSTLTYSSSITVNNTAPTTTSVILTNESGYYNTSRLTCTGAYSDADNDPEGTQWYKWFINNVSIPNTASYITYGTAGFNTYDEVICEHKTSDTGYTPKNSSIHNNTVIIIANYQLSISPTSKTINVILTSSNSTIINVTKVGPGAAYLTYFNYTNTKLTLNQTYFPGAGTYPVLVSVFANLPEANNRTFIINLTANIGYGYPTNTSISVSTNMINLCLNTPCPLGSPFCSGYYSCYYDPLTCEYLTGSCTNYTHCSLVPYQCGHYMTRPAAQPIQDLGTFFGSAFGIFIMILIPLVLIVGIPGIIAAVIYILYKFITEGGFSQLSGFVWNKKGTSFMGTTKSKGYETKQQGGFFKDTNTKGYDFKGNKPSGEFGKAPVKKWK